MKLTSRKTHNFIDINVDEISVTVFKSDQAEINARIQNLLDIAEDLASYTGKPLILHVKKRGA